MKFRVGVDIGGTFTDIVMLRNKEVSILKKPTTGHAPEIAVLDGIHDTLEKFHLEPSECIEFVNSSTVAVNTIVQRKGARVGLIVSKGFKDLMAIGRMKMPDPFSLTTMRRPPLVPKIDIRGVTERIDAKGNVITALDLDELMSAARSLMATGVESLAILFLHSYANAAHEKQAKNFLVEQGINIPISVSAEIWPQVREYERASALVMNAYTTPPVATYISKLSERRKEIGMECPMYISGSNGGIITVDLAVNRPILTLLSGPSAGIVAAVHLMRSSGIDKAITLDMGGTSADICVLRQADVPYAWGQEIEGQPVTLPYVDVSSIGSGGGSIASVDNLGVLKVGPNSAGSVPGPASYGRGGTEATLTDAYVCNGIVAPSNFGGGGLQLDSDKAIAAVEDIAKSIRLSVADAAEGIIRVTTSNLLAELTRLTAQYGIDPREFTLIPFGGAGPTHAAFLADQLGMKKIAIPMSPGNFCALGSLLADFRLDYLFTQYTRLDQVDHEDVERWFESVEASGRESLVEVQDELQEIVLNRFAELRYLGQGFEVTIPFESIDDIPQLFAEEYWRLYGRRQEDDPIEIINFRATLIGRRPPQTFQNIPETPTPSQAQYRPAYLNGKQQEIRVYRREDIGKGWRADGPLFIDQSDTTCALTDGWSVSVDEVGTLFASKDLK